MKRLPNYIRMHRRKHALTQAELAFLIGGVTETAILRHERFARKPSLDCALAYAALFQVDAGELFIGLQEELEAGLVKRAEVLLETLPPGRLSSEARTKRLFLESVVVMHSSVCEG